MNPRKTVALAVAAALTALSLAACGSDDTPTDNTGPVTITVAGPEAAWHEAVGKAFTDVYPDVTVEFVQADETTDATLGEADVVTVADPSQLAKWVKDKKVLDVRDIAQTVAAPAILDYVNDDGVWAVPVTQDPYVLFYNKDLFDEAGVDVPDGSWVWTDFTTAATALAGKLKDPAHATYLPRDAEGTAGLAAAQAGDTADLMGGEDYTFLKPAYQRAASLIAGKAAPTHTEESGAVRPEDAFLAGDVAMILYPASLTQALAGQVEFTWGLAPVPQRDKLTAGLAKTPVTVGAPVGYAIPADLDPAHLDGAKAWLQYIGSESAAIQLAAQGVVAAVASDGVTNAYFEREGLPADSLSRFAFQTHTITAPVSLDAKAGEVWAAVTEANEALLAAADADSIDARLAELTDQIKGIVK
ncbi:MAG: extracellular solute-binding protein [Propionibacteriaceae bacterium]|nr:extracellular solute-binding protein [Propionibacteriaceae bacterium]